MSRAIWAIALTLVIALATLADAADAPHWKRAGGRHAYRFTGTEQHANGASRIELDVELVAGNGEPEVLTILRGRASGDTAQLQPIRLDDGCVHEFGGADGALGRIVLTEGFDPDKAAPQCVPENVFGAVTDLAAMLLVQHRFFGVSGLKAAGDSVRFGPFETAWTRRDPAVRARVSAPGGVTKLARLGEGRAAIEWRPDPMEIAIARRVAPGQTILLRGTERFALELAIDPRSGELLAARSLEDRLELRLWPVPGADLPPLSPPPAGPGMPMRIDRALTLEAP